MERGAGETLACGTGVRVAVACVLNKLTGREIDVELKGGTLHIHWDEISNHVYMAGGARHRLLRHLPHLVRGM